MKNLTPVIRVLLPLFCAIIMSTTPALAEKPRHGRTLDESIQEWEFRALGRWVLKTSSNAALNLHCERSKTCSRPEADALVAPAGFRICLAQIHRRGWRVGGTASFSGTLVANTTKLSYYYYGGENFDLHAFARLLVIPQQTNDPSCMKNGALWRCPKGQCSYQQKGVLIP
jgi:hypothetical protein